MFLKYKFLFFLSLFISCKNTNDNKNINPKNEKSYIVDIINEKDIIKYTAEKYDTNRMVFVEGGRFNFGSNIGLDREKPESEVVIQSFLIDKNLVTVEDFRVFVNLSGYTTEAEKYGNAIVYNDSIDIWELVDGANWQYPLGGNKTLAFNNHPVTQVSWNDALAYCEFCDKTLPSEVQ